MVGFVAVARPAQGPVGLSGRYVRSSQLDLAAGQAFSIFSECDAGDAVMSGGFDVGANFTLEEFRPATTDPEQWIYGGANLATSPLQAYWWIVCLDMTP